jgi:lysophospholipid acyltransferase (LPLAT)-like uncharacterized protein
VTESYPRRVGLLARAGSWLVRVLGMTWRIRVTNDGALRAARAAGQPVIFSLWHGQLLPLLYHHRNEGVTVLISEHGDGEIIARIATKLGYRTVRGSTSRGAARALIELTKVLATGRDLAITPDGPRGPAKSYAPGPLIVAQRSGAPIVPVGVTASSSWNLKSWDRFLIPKPFSRVSIAYGDFVHIDADTARDAAAGASRVGDLMLAAEAKARG